MTDNIDARTGRTFGDHGTAMQAIEFALDRLHVERDTFLNSWREGDLDEWPEFYVWLAKQPTPAPETHVDVEGEIASVVQSVNEWDDRTSPDDYPDHLLITSEELTDILRNFAETLDGRDNG